MSLSIKISGPGQTFDLEMHYIQKLLEDMGWRVEIKNDYTNDRLGAADDQTMSELLLRARKGRNINDVAVIVADHLPWGG